MCFRAVWKLTSILMRQKTAVLRWSSTARSALPFAYRTMMPGRRTSCGAAFDSERAHLWPVQAAALSHHALGTIAIDIPVMLAFFLLLATRPGLPRRPLMLERLNMARAKSGKAALLEQIEVYAPLLPEYKSAHSSGSRASQRSRRLHHVRGHLVRRGSKLFWRGPHMRGSARAGTVR